MENNGSLSFLLQLSLWLFPSGNNVDPNLYTALVWEAARNVRRNHYEQGGSKSQVTKDGVHQSKNQLAASTNFYIHSTL